jgi:hypothetical protein
MTHITGDLGQRLASCGHGEDRIAVIEHHVLNRFAETAGLQDLKAKRDRYWSIAHELLSAAQSLISQHSLRRLIAMGDVGSRLIGTPPLQWSDRTPAQIGPPAPLSLEPASEEARLYREFWLLNVVKAAIAHVLWDRAKHTFPDLRKRWDPSIDAAYPYRDIDDRPVHLLSDLEAEGLGKAIDAVVPFIDAHVGTAARRSLYSANLYPARIDAARLQSPREHALIGQAGVFAARTIADHTCIGVYGGMLLDNADRIMLADQRYLARCPGAQTRYVNGENMLSLLNTTLRYDENGGVAGQGNTGINVSAYAIRCKAQDGTPQSFIALFTKGEVERDRELRWSYGYNERSLVELGLN